MKKLMMGALALSLFGCGVLKTRDKNEAEVSKIKSVAVVAFTADLPASQTIGLNLNSGKAEGGAGGSMITQHSDQVDQMYAEIVKGFGSQMKWKVIDPKAMSSNPGYIKAYKKTMEGWQNKMPPGAGMNRFMVKGIMDFDSPRILDVPGRDELIKDLGVDAIVVTQANVHLNGTTVMGIGSRHPQASLTFFVYKKGEAKPIWFEGKIDGDEMKESVGKTGFIDEKRLAELSLESTKTAIPKLNQGPTN